MQIDYTTEAFASLFQLVNFIEGKNTRGAGLRWLDRYDAFLQKNLLNPSLIKLWQNRTFRNLALRCLNYKDWLIAFSIQENRILIEALLHKSRIVD